MRARGGRNRSAVAAPWSTALLSTLLLCVAAAPAQGSDTNATEAQKLAAKVVYRQKGLTEARVVELMGAPTHRTATGDAATLTWGEAGDPCAMTATFKDGALGEVTLTPGAAADKKACKTRARPLLDAAPAPGSPAAQSAASLSTLDNDSIVAMVKEGRPAQAIIARIQTEPCAFDLSVEATIKLRRDGVGESVIQAMTDRGCH